METARKIIENRVNGLGISEPLVQLQGTQRIIVELPGVENEAQALELIRETGLLEFIDAGYEPVLAGTQVQTDYIPGLPLAEAPATDRYDELGNRIYHTVMTGEALKSAAATVNPDSPTGSNKYAVAFELQSNWATFFSEYTGSRGGEFLAIVLDKTVISCPQIQERIPDGKGVISGNFEGEEARALAVQLRYGALPVPLRIESNQKIGPSLGQESIQQSVKAGIVGLSAVLIFMLVYYRLPGLLADLSLIIYGALNFAVFKMGSTFMIVLAVVLLIIYLIERKDTWQLWMFIGLLMVALVLNFKAVTLTLPGIAGFLLSTGMAVDANILIFERIKEELRGGRSLSAALNAGFDRAWMSIWDSQASTLIICTILYIFGSNFGASIVKGFAITLAIGTVINLFTAITITRTFMSAVFEAAKKGIEKRRWLLGI
ncbi:MAG: preprotein translocase subunit SecD [Anaerolineae bacterium]|nr:preprotein translocase subunit SecD [Anaerolineae bacterium]